MSKFKVGDKVRLRDDLEVGEKYNGVVFLSGMKELQGKELTIGFIFEDGDYAFEESDYYYSEEMLEKVFNDEEYKKNKIKEQELEDMKKRCNDFENYCSNNKCCIDCDVRKFQKCNGLDGLGTRNCMLVYEYLFKK